MNREGKKCVLYPRVSTEMQVDGYSLEGQKNSLKRFADREEMEIVGIYEDAGKSGKSIEGRPAFKKMLSDIKNGLEIDYILVYKLSRFGRNAADILNSLEFVQSYGINLICIEEGIDSSQTSGKLLISVLSAVAEIERENIIEQTMNGRREKARQGGWNGGFAPYGYYLKDNQLLIEETEAEAIRIIFDKFANSDVGLGGVAKYLNLQGIKKIPRQNGTLETWSSHFIRLILDNPVYCGKIAYLIKEIQIYPNGESEMPLKSIEFNFPIYRDGQEVRRLLWEKGNTVETVVLLSRETNPLTVEVRMEVETGEVKEHPTYKRIQEYVQEKYGFKVHTAYIAEVKRMVGLDMHKAPNAVEQRKHEYHPCPPEKVEAIKDALRHFGLTSE